MKVQFTARQRLDRQRVVVVVAVGELSDDQSIGTKQRGGVGRVVLVHEDGVKQSFLTDDAVNLAERQMLMLEYVVVRAVQLAQ